MFNALALIGMRGSGKSSVSKIISEKYKIKPLCLDELFEAEHGPINSFVDQYGWETFRTEESRILFALQKKNQIIDCGGGIILKDKNIKQLRRLAYVICIHPGLNVLKSRLKHSDRPSLTGQSTCNEIDDVWAKRENLYRQASDVFFEQQSENDIEKLADDIYHSWQKTKICVSIQADQVQTLQMQYDLAKEKAAIVEVRLDQISLHQCERLSEMFSDCSTRTIATCRVASQGGAYIGNEEDRVILLKRAVELGADCVDLESNLWSRKNEFFPADIICSQHYFDGTPDTSVLFGNNDSLKISDKCVSKIIPLANSLKDAFNYLEQTKTLNKNHISFSMGAFGQFTRISTAKFGSALSYASLSDLNKTAPGQVSVSELHDTYHWKSINHQTKLYGVLGSKANETASAFLHNAMFKAKGINARLLPLQAKQSDLPQLAETLINNDFHGLAVTMPFKQDVMAWASKRSSRVEKIKACNTLGFKSGDIWAENTDCLGAMRAFEKYNVQLAEKKVLLLGAGGAARAILVGLLDHQAQVFVLNRNQSKAVALSNEFGVEAVAKSDCNALIAEFDVIINCTSIGKGGEHLFALDALHDKQIVMDIVYRPLHTDLLTKALSKHCTIITGEKMLIFQAMEQFKLWTGFEASYETCEKAFERYLKMK